MSSTFAGLEMGKRSLMAHQQGLKVISQNLSNADNEAYSRQRVILETVEPLYRADLTRVHRPGQVGQGVQVAEIRRERDIYLDQRIYSEVGKTEFWKASEFYLKDVEAVYNALGESNLQEKMDMFWATWQELASNPSEAAVREDLVQKSLSLTSDFRDKYEKFNNLRHEINSKIIHDVNNVNDISAQIAKLNKAIFDSQSVGDNPNDLLDRRDALVEQLSAYGDVKVSFKDRDEMMVHFGGRIIVQGQKRNLLELNQDFTNDGLMRVTWKTTGDDFDATTEKGGLIIAHLQARDEMLPREIKNLDTLASNMMFGVNNLHRQGFDELSRKGEDFFTVYPSTIEVNGNADVNADGNLESSLVYQVTGGAKLDGNTVLGSSGEITLKNEFGQDVVVQYTPNESINQVINKINLADSTVNARLDFDGRLILKSRSYSEPYPFSLEKISDSGDFLSYIAEVFNQPGANFQNSDLDAANTFNTQAEFIRTPIKQVSSWIAVNPRIVFNSDLIAARAGNDYDQVRGAESASGKNNGDIAKEIARLRHDKTLFDRQDSFNEFYVGTVGQVGTQLNHAQMELDKYDSIQSALKEVRQAYSGVNIDEELANMVALQNGYQAGAKIIKLMDEMLQTVIGLVG